jgi:hypothetical protein
MGSYTHTCSYAHAWVLTTYGLKLISESDAVFVFASEYEGGRRLIVQRFQRVALACPLPASALMISASPHTPRILPSSTSSTGWPVV